MAASEPEKPIEKSAKDAEAISDAAVEKQAEEPAKTPVEKPVVHRPVAGIAAAGGERRSILSGSSIGEIMNGAGKEPEAAATQEPETAPERSVDARSEEKINAARGAFLGEIHRHRPRIAMALEEMRVTGNEIRVGVPTQQLYEEIMRNRSEIIESLRNTARITGRVDLIVEIVDDGDQTRKPIKAEDKLKFLTDRNPLLTEFRKGLALELE